MTERETDLMREFKARLDRLITNHSQLKHEKQLLIEEKLHCEAQLRLMGEKNEALVKQVENLKFANSLLKVDEGSHEAKIKINRIVREIDKCIAMLNK